jgi:ribonucleoside-diphosphate reductase alpha chain
VFDCAFKAAKGTRSIHYMGHVRMMAATQPFLSGAISKTVNMPENATVEEVEHVYMEGWRLGLKAIAIYRDGSKRQQPLTTSIAQKEKDQKARAVEEPTATTAPSAAQVVPASAPISLAPRRRRLPDERRSITHRFSVGGHKGYITVGLYDDGKPGEMFITMNKEGSVMSGLVHSLSASVSIALQYGVPLEALVNKFAHTRFEPSGFTTNPNIKIAKSIVDYVFRWMGQKFLDEHAQKQLGIQSEVVGVMPADALALPLSAPRASEKQVDLFTAPAASAATHTATFDNQSDAPACGTCGSMMVRNAACYKCLNCGSTSGCS